MPLARNSVSRVCLQGCDVPLRQLLVALRMLLIMSSEEARIYIWVCMALKNRTLYRGKKSFCDENNLAPSHTNVGVVSSMVSASTFEHTEQDSVKVTTENTTKHFSAQNQHLELHQETN